MIGWAVAGVFVYAFGATGWGFYNYNMWASSERYPEERIMYARRVLATPYWPLAMLKIVLDWMTAVRAEIDEHDRRDRGAEE